MRDLTRQDLDDILNGAAILGAGGGGDLQEGIDMIDEALAAGKRFRLASVEEVPDDAVICTPYMLGAISQVSAEEAARYDSLPRRARHPLLDAYDAFQTHLGQTFFGTVPCEMGGSNTAAAFYAAAMSDHVVVDADPAGRAVPEITHSAYYLAGLPAAPIYAANWFGEDFVLDGIRDDMRAETIVRALSTVSRNDIAAIDHALPMRDLRSVLIEGTISNALALGKTWRAARTRGEDVAPLIAAQGGGFVAFEGEISACRYTTEHGFTLGEVMVSGSGDNSGQTMRISVKNENMACWIDGAVHATVPDLICLFDQDAQAQISNPDAREGLHVSVVILPAPPLFRSAAGLEIFGPSYAGVDAPYRWRGEG